jgi:hypothetical protein
MVIIEDKKRSNQTVILPFIGETSFNEEGRSDIECSLEDAKSVVDTVEGITIIDTESEGPRVEEIKTLVEGSYESGDEIQRKSEENELGEFNVEVLTTPVSGTVENSNDSGTSATKQIIEEISKLNLSDLKDLAKDYSKENDVPSSNWNSKNKEDLKLYLISKLS